eukprot:m.14132 g.14132  ORF g.14132 m.14132 type:complete len:518 (-) comp4993_c0_seq1:305-1858(-)
MRVDSRSEGAEDLVGHTLEPTRPPLGFFSLLMVAFFWVSGGIYGNEALLQYASPGHIVAVLIIVPLFLGLPVALISTELASALPFDGGAVAWVEEAFGTRLGAQNTYWLWLCYTVDAAVYPIFAASYVSQHWDIFGLHTTEGDEGAADVGLSSLACFIVFLCTIIQLSGTNALISANTVFACLSLIPTFIYMLWGLGDIPSSFGDPEMTNGDSTDFSLLFSWGIWLSQGYISLGCLSGEVENPSRTMTGVVMILTPFVVFLNIVPLAVSWGLDDNATNYEPGHFDVLATEFRGPWLGYLFLVGSIMCQLGLLNSTMMASQRIAYFFLQTRFPRVFGMYSQKSSSKLFHYLWVDPSPGVPAGIIIFNALLTCGATWLPYDVLIEMVILCAAPSMVLFLLAFVALRIQRPELDRPYRLPGGVGMAIGFATPPMILTLIQVVVTGSERYPVYGIPYFKLVTLFLMMLLGITFQFSYDVSRWGFRETIRRMFSRHKNEGAPLLFADEGRPITPVAPTIYSR